MPFAHPHVFQKKRTLKKKNDWRTIKSSVFCKKASQICLIHALKESRFTMIAREKKRGLCCHPFAGKHDCKDKGKVS
jgi:hypothetical protein